MERVCSSRVIVDCLPLSLCLSEADSRRGSPFLLICCMFHSYRNFGTFWLCRLLATNARIIYSQLSSLATSSSFLPVAITVTYPPVRFLAPLWPRFTTDRQTDTLASSAVSLPFQKCNLIKRKRRYQQYVRTLLVEIVKADDGEIVYNLNIYITAPGETRRFLYRMSYASCPRVLTYVLTLVPVVAVSETK